MEGRLGEAFRRALRQRTNLQRYFRYAGRNVQPDLPLDRQRLQRERTIAAANQNIGAEASHDGGLSALTRIIAGQYAAAPRVDICTPQTSGRRP